MSRLDSTSTPRVSRAGCPRRGRRPAAMLFCLVGALLLAAALPARASSPDDNWSTAFAKPGVEGPLAATALWSGNLVVGGQFAFAGGLPMINVARWDGSRFQPMGAGLNGAVRSLANVGSALYAAGSFDHSGATPLPGLARFTGSAWVAVGSGGPDNVGGLKVVADGADLLLLGGFDSIGAPAVAAHLVARWNGSAWSAIGYPDLTAPPTCAARVNGTLYLGSDSDTPLVAFDGANWNPVLGLDPPESGSLAITAMAGLNGLLYVTGNFPSAEGGTVLANGIACWDGAHWTSLGDIVPDGPFRGLSVDNGMLLAVGEMISDPTSGFGWWDGSQWLTGTYGLGGCCFPGGPVLSATRAGSDLFLAGGFDYFYDFYSGGNRAVKNLARFDGVYLHPVTNGTPILDGTAVWGTTVYNNRLIATGEFNNTSDHNLYAGHQPVNGIAEWDGGAWHNLSTGLFEPFGGYGKAVAVWNNTLVVGGRFTEAGGVATQNIALWDGSAWQGLAGGLTGNDVSNIVVYNGQIIVASPYGLGTDVAHGAPMGIVARWTGTQWQSIATIAGGFTLGTCGLTVWNNKLIFASSFSSINGVPAKNIAQWDGTNWSALGAGFNGWAITVGVHNNQLYASGPLVSSGATTLPGFVARWTGSAWVPVGTSGFNGVAFAMQSVGGKMYMTGNFTTADGAPVNGVAAWDGTTWSALGSGIAGGCVYGTSLTPWFDGLFVGGCFTTAGTKSSALMARWQYGDVAAVTPPPPVAATGLALSPPTPNPALGQVHVAFRLPEDAPVHAAIYDASGRLVQSIADEALTAGPHELSWQGRDDNGRRVSAGIYWMRVATPTRQASTRIVWLR